MKTVCVATTSPLIVSFFLVPHLRTLGASYRVTLVVNTKESIALPDDLGVEVIHIGIERKIRLTRDFAALWRLIRLFQRRRFDVVHSFGPKAGLLCSMAGWLTGVANRIHTFTGQVWITRKGFSRTVLRLTDRVTALLTTQLLADSWSQRTVLIDQGIVDPQKCSVLASGSISGVDLNRFRPNAEARARVRSEARFSDQTVVFLFLGRFTRDKGVLDLAHAFAALNESFRNVANAKPCALLMVGLDEDNIRPQIESICGRTPLPPIFIEITRKPEDYIAASDVLCLPSYREGFGSAVIEAAAVGVPTIGSDIYGVRDAVVDGRTGLLFPAGDVAALTASMRRMLDDAALRRRLGEQARMRAEHEFSQERIMLAVTDFYSQMLKK